MLKEEWIAKAAQKTSLTKKQVKECYEALESIFLETIENGEDVKLSGFGVFHLKDHVSSSLRNPKSNVLLPAKRVRSISFTASNTLKDELSK